MHWKQECKCVRCLTLHQLSAWRLSVQTSFKGHCSRTYGTCVFQTPFACHVTVPLVGASVFSVNICVCSGGDKWEGAAYLELDTDLVDLVLVQLHYTSSHTYLIAKQLQFTFPSYNFLTYIDLCRTSLPENKFNSFSSFLSLLWPVVVLVWRFLNYGHAEQQRSGPKYYAVMASILQLADTISVYRIVSVIHLSCISCSRCSD